jgi:hypothetical protein
MIRLTMAVIVELVQLLFCHGVELLAHEFADVMGCVCEQCENRAGGFSSVRHVVARMSKGFGLRRRPSVK